MFVAARTRCIYFARYISSGWAVVRNTKARIKYVTILPIKKSQSILKVIQVINKLCSLCETPFLPERGFDFGLYKNIRTSSLIDKYKSMNQSFANLPDSIETINIKDYL